VADVQLHLLAHGLRAAWETDGTEYEEGGCAGGEKMRVLMLSIEPSLGHR